MVGTPARRCQTSDLVFEPGRDFFYFAYGSNMSSLRLRAADRAPSARCIAIGRVVGYRLAFDKIARFDGSGKCDCEWTGRVDGPSIDALWGVVWLIDEAERAALDRVEGKGAGYRDAIVVVQTERGPLRAMTYLATEKDRSLRPFDWYRHHVLEGAIEAGLPREWIAAIRAVPSLEDPDRERSEREYARHRAPVDRGF